MLQRLPPGSSESNQFSIGANVPDALEVPNGADVRVWALPFERVVSRPLVVEIQPYPAIVVNSVKVAMYRREVVNGHLLSHVGELVPREESATLVYLDHTSQTRNQQPRAKPQDAVRYDPRVVEDGVMENLLASGLRDPCARCTAFVGYDPEYIPLFPDARSCVSLILLHDLSGKRTQV